MTPSGSSVHGILQARLWSGLPLPSPGDLPDTGIKPRSLTSPALAGRFFTRHSLSFASSLVYSPTPISSLFKRKTTNPFPWHMQGRFPLVKTLGLRLHQVLGQGSGSGVQLSRSLQAFLKAYFPHQGGFFWRSLVPAVRIIRISPIYYV